MINTPPWLCWDWDRGSGWGLGGTLAEAGTGPARVRGALGSAEQAEEGQMSGSIQLHERQPRTVPSCASVRDIFEPNASYPTSSLIDLSYAAYFQGSLITSYIAGIEVGLDKRNLDLRYGRLHPEKRKMKQMGKLLSQK